MAKGAEKKARKGTAKKSQKAVPAEACPEDCTDLRDRAVRAFLVPAEDKDDLKTETCWLPGFGSFRAQPIRYVLTLTHKQDCVDGNIELLMIKPALKKLGFHWAYCNDEGKINHLPSNGAAERFVQLHPGWDFVAGNALFCK